MRRALVLALCLLCLDGAGQTRPAKQLSGQEIAQAIIHESGDAY
jgi:hypothetical protein